MIICLFIILNIKCIVINCNCICTYDYFFVSGGCEEPNDYFTLCEAANLWLIRWRAVSIWRKSSFTHLHWPKHDSPKVYTIHENRLSVRTESKIHIYLIKNEGTLKLDTIYLPWNCSLEYRVMEMDLNHVVVGFNNVLVIYERDDTYKIKYAYTFNGNVFMATKGFRDFIGAGRNPFFVNIIKIVRLAGDSLWIKVKFMYFHATYFHIDLTNGTFTNIFPYRNVKYVCGSENLLVFRENEDEVVILAVKGATLLRILEVNSHFSLSVNNKLLSLITHAGLAIYEISSGGKITNISIPTFCKFAIVNPLFDIVYSIHEDAASSLDILSSFCMKTGRQLWSSTLEEKIPVYFRQKAVTVSIVLGTFIVIKTGGKDRPYVDDGNVKSCLFYIFDANNGELIRKSNYKHFLLVSDSYLCDSQYLRKVT